MTLQEFQKSLQQATPPGLSAHLLALWHAARGDWHHAHDLVQDLPDADASWIHAYLHRVEGDRSNAHYWYNRAGKPPCHTSLDKEWTALAEALLKEKQK